MRATPDAEVWGYCPRTLGNAVDEDKVSDSPILVVPVDPHTSSLTNDVTRPYKDHTQSNTYGPKHIGSPQHKKLAAGARCTVVVLYSAQLCCTMMVQCVGVL